MELYLIGSLRNDKIPTIANELRKHEIGIFDSWFAAGPSADDSWRDYEKGRGHTYQEALDGYAAKHVFSFDKFYLNRSHGGILVYPAGKSGHLELGYLSSQGKPTFILLDEIPERYDVMKQFASEGVFHSLQELLTAIKGYSWPKLPELPMLYEAEIMWLVGLLEGEGSFCISDNTPRLVLQMTDYDIVARAAELFGSKVWGGKRKTKGDKAIWACGVAGLTAIEWMRILRPYLGSRRNEQIQFVVQEWLTNKTYNRKDNNYWRNVFK